MNDFEAIRAYIEHEVSMKLPRGMLLSSRSRNYVLRATISLALLILLAGCGRNETTVEPTPDLPVAEPTVIVLATATTEPNAETESLTTLLSEVVPLTATVPLTAPIVSDAVTGDDVTADVQGVELAFTDAISESVRLTPELVVGTVTAALINVRSEPNLNANVVRMVDEGVPLPIYGTSGDSQWLRICCDADDGDEQWVAAEFVQTEGDLSRANQIAAASSTIDGAGDTGNRVQVSADLVNLRGGPGVGYAIVGQVKEGDSLDLIGKNEAGDWLKSCCLQDEDGQETWISAGLVTVPSELLAVLSVAETPALPEAPPQAAAAPEPGQSFVAAAAPGLPGDGGFGGAGGTNPLTGTPLAGDRPGQRPVIVCINNDYAARPQYGISQADVMYEYLMEGFGITRYSGVFYGDTVGQIGPVRSARLINYYMGALYNAGLACSGASDQVRFTLKHESPFPYMDIDLDDPSNTRYSVSIGQDYRTRLRTATDQLRRWLAEWGAEEPARLRGFTFGDAGGGSPASSISIPYPSGTGSQVNYLYDGGSGRYMRSLGGAPHLDGNSGAQVGVENVVVQVVPHEITDIVEDSLGSKSIRLNLFGSGVAIVFRDGQAYRGTWRSDSRGDTPRFYRDDGSEILLKPGRTWISVVQPDYALSYQ